jgi:hypothetical protein
MHVLLAALAIASPGFHEAKQLEPAASFVAQKPVIVRCADSDAAWHDLLARRLGNAVDTNGRANVGGHQLWLAPNVCDVLRFNGQGIGLYDYPLLSASVETLTHEALHLRGETNEGVTDCAAMHDLPKVAVKFFHVPAGSALRAFMVDAWFSHRDKRTNPLFRTVC